MTASDTQCGLMRLSLLVWILVGVCFAAVAAIIMTLTGDVRPRWVPVKIESSVTAEKVVATVTIDELRRHLDALAPWPSRVPGTPGHDAAAEYVRRTFTELGMKVLEHPILVTVPVTKYCQLLDPHDRPVDGVRLHPFWPNLVRTCTIPEPGIRATVVMGTEGGAHLYEFAGHEPSQTIPIVPLSCTEEWIGLADAGFPAVIFFRDATARPRHYRRKELNFPANFPRFLLVGDPRDLHGHRVRLRCKVDWETIEVPQIFGVLEPDGGGEQANKKHREAVILTAHYDSISTTADLAPGAEEASSLAALLATARFAAEQRHQLRRTMVFIALTAHGEAARGVRLLAELWGQPGEEQNSQRRLTAHIAAMRNRLELLEGEVQVISDPAYWTIAGEEQDQREEQYWQSRPPGLPEVFLEDVRRVIEANVYRARELLITRDLARVRSGSRPGSPEERAYQESRRKVQQLRFAATATLLDLKTYRGFQSNHVWLDALDQRLEKKRERLEADVERSMRSLEAQELLHSFDRHIVFCLAVTSGAPGNAVFAIYPNSRRASDGATGWLGAIAAELTSDVRPLVPLLAEVDPGDEVGWARAQALYDDGVNTEVPYPAPSMRAGSMSYELSFSYEYLPLLAEGRHAVAWVTPQDPVLHMGTAEDTFDRLNHKNLLLATRVIAAATTRMGAGQVQLNATPHLPRTKSVNGRVLQAADPNSVIPTRGVEGALVVARHRRPRKIGSVRQEDIVVTNEEGNFRFPPNDGMKPPDGKPPEDFQAFRIDPTTGRIIAVKDQGEKGEGSFPSKRTWNNFDNPLRLMLFRCSQTDLFYPLHPSTSTGLGSAFCVESRTLSQPESFAVLSGNPFPVGRDISQVIHEVPAQGFALFNPPATKFYVGLRGKSALDLTTGTEVTLDPTTGAELERVVQTVVAYLVGGQTLEPEPPEGREIWGPGYLAHDVPLFQMWSRQAALSMAAIDGYRLGRQEKHRVADPLLLQQHEAAATLSQAANDKFAVGDYAGALHAAQDSLAISMQVYPRIAETERDAIVGVLFYLFLMIPFSFFMERLLFGFPDIRPQIAGVVGIFAVVFVALRYLHPAFELVSSGLMVLLGFLTLALSLFMTLFLFGKFRTNMKQLRLKLQQTAEAADVSRAAAAGTAFLLGINNMRKRKVRTAFTCITLVLVTFALLSLTAVRRGSRFKRIAVGDAPYTGILITGPNNQPLPGTAALVERFGSGTTVSHVRYRERIRGITRYGGSSVSRGKPGEAGAEEFPIFEITTIVGMDPEEVNVTNVADALVCGRWFRSDSERVCLLPINLARQMDITKEMAKRGETTVYLDAEPIKVVGLFDPEKLERVYDLNGQSLLPLDGTMITEKAPEQVRERLESQIKAPEHAPRLPGDQVVLIPSQECGGYVSRLAVNLGALSPSEAMRIITDFLKRWEDFVYYGIGGIAYYGRIYRGTQVEGLGEILIPILIAGAIVLNTMLGSVYERTREIGIYSAVGLSPTHVRYLFLAEACVYATVGSVVGYLAAHGTGTILSRLNLTGGLSFNYSTLSTVYATLVLVAAVFLSTWYPARKASRLASPSKGTSIKVPVPRGDVMNIVLPFTYVELDAVSVIPFLYDVLEDHGEGSSSEFYCGPPELVSEDKFPAGLRVVGGNRGFGIQARCWLRPYDLGVSQMLTLAICPTSFENVWSAHLHLKRLSGDLNSWRRTNQLFLTVLRRHFLSWRGLEEEQKDEYLVRGLAALQIPLEQYLSEGKDGNAGKDSG